MAINHISAALVAASLSPATPPPTTAQTVHFRGPITPVTAAKLTALLKSPRVTTLVINSFGGSEDAALDIAAIIKARKLTVVVDGVCMSACAQYILTSASSGQIRPGSLVAFHTSSYAIHEWSSRYSAKDGDYRFLATASADLSKRIEKLLPAVGEESMLLGAFSMLKPLCVAPRASTGLPPRIKLAAAFAIPTRDALLRLGVVAPLGWPETIRDAARYLGPHIRPGTPFVIGNPFDFRTLPPMVKRCT